ncbi:MAG: beta-ketoacyl synthase chain length factor [Bacteroidales bacterium]|jgi:3-oxoacyl-(acyl-carrier-protein) synthase|nr:beta-ketoacyl synthase chain length factor [Bacteroidales bacterium]
MQAYITSIGLISPQDTASNRFSFDLKHENAPVLRCVEPDYKQLIPPLQLRRMSRILKMGMGAAQICLNNAGEIQPDAILVGTGLACVNELESFMLSMLDSEQGLSSIPFINSSHNTIAAQISKMLHNHSYNNTYCHRGTSFESALTDALMLLNGQEAEHVLLGGIDEYSEQYHSLIQKTGDTATAGEGAAFFLLSRQPAGKVFGRITAAQTFYKPADGFIDAFLSDHHLRHDDIDTVLCGINGTESNDQVYGHPAEGIFRRDTQWASYKHLCGEYTTGGSFALALAACSLLNGRFPASCILRNRRRPQRILIYNHYHRLNYSLVTVERAQ